LSESQSFGAGAPEGTPALLNIQKYIPQLVEDAKHILKLKGGTEQLARQAGIDPLTGLPDHHSMSRLFSRLSEGDIIIAIELSDPSHLEASPGAESSDDVVRAFSRALRHSVRETDHLGRMPMARGFLIVMRKAGPPAAYRLLARLRSAWARDRPAPANFVAGIATTSADGWRPTVLAAERALQRAMQSEACWATATEGDFDIMAGQSARSDAAKSGEAAAQTSAPELHAANPPP
jgi:GGDEF domain-containing protein